MPVISSREKAEITDMIQRISDERVRYFYLMLGSALAMDAPSAAVLPRANTGPDHIADIQARFNR